MRLGILPADAMHRHQSGKADAGAINGAKKVHVDPCVPSSPLGGVIRDDAEVALLRAPHIAAPQQEKLTNELVLQRSVAAITNRTLLSTGQHPQRIDHANLVTESTARRHRQLLRMHEEGILRTLGPFELESMMAQSSYASAGPPFYQPSLASRNTSMNQPLSARAAVFLSTSQQYRDTVFPYFSSSLFSSSSLRLPISGIPLSREKFAATGTFPQHPILLHRTNMVEMGRIPKDERVKTSFPPNSSPLSTTCGDPLTTMRGKSNSAQPSPPEKDSKEEKEEESLGQPKEDKVQGRKITSVKKGPQPLVKKRKSGTRDRRFNSATPISLVASARSSSTTVSLELTNRPPVGMYLDVDFESLSEYQCFLRKQIELFEARTEDLQHNAQKMNKAVVLGQVGIRCKHCAHKDPWARSRGAVYYSASLGGLYQAGQNMSKNHLDNHCSSIPAESRQKLTQLKESKRRAGGGKVYWADSAAALGVFEDQYGLRFSKEVPDIAKNFHTVDDKYGIFPCSDLDDGNTKDAWTIKKTTSAGLPLLLPPKGTK